MNIYLISGLGADKSAFQKLRFPENFKVYHIEWIKPEKDNDINSYAIKIADQIDNTKPFILIGLSFGGIIVNELIKIINPHKSIIISSIKNRSEIPTYLRFISRVKFHCLFPTKFYNRPNFILYWLFGTKKEDERRLLCQILENSDVHFMRWAFNAILHWRQNSIDTKIIHIHGTHDRMLPIRFVKPNYRIFGGGHFMVYSKAEEINQILAKELSRI